MGSSICPLAVLEMYQTPGRTGRFWGCCGHALCDVLVVPALSPSACSEKLSWPLWAAQNSRPPDETQVESQRSSRLEKAVMITEINQQPDQPSLITKLCLLVPQDYDLSAVIASYKKSSCSLKNKIKSVTTHITGNWSCYHFGPVVPSSCSSHLLSFALICFFFSLWVCV